MSTRAAANQPSRPPATLPLLARAHSPITAQRIHAEKIQHKPLLLRTTEAGTHPTNARSERRLARQQKQEQQRRRRKKPAPLTAAEKRKYGVYDIPKEEIKYKLYEGLHRLWCGYIREILGLSRSVADGDHSELRRPLYVTPAHAGPLIASADFHGALVTVVRCKCVGRVGTEGIVVRDTRGTFVLVTKNDVLRTVPKEGSVFQLKVPVEESIEVAGESSGKDVTGESIERRELVFEVHGNQIRTRAPERANKKFKRRFDPDL